MAGVPTARKLCFVYSFVSVCQYQSTLPNRNRNKFAISFSNLHHSSKAALNMFGNILGVEEPEITTVSVRPGVVDTEMQAVIRNDGKKKKNIRANIIIEHCNQS